MTGKDLDCPEFFQDPYPFYRRIREEEGGVLWLDHQLSSTRGLWLFAGFADAMAIFKETSAISKCLSKIRAPGMGSPFDLSVLHRDAPDHPRLRKLVGDYFSPATIAKLQKRVAAIAAELLDDLSRRGEGDFIADFAEPLPLRVVGEMLGVPREDLGRIRAWTRVMADGFDSLLLKPETVAAPREAMREFLAYADALAQAAPPARGESLLSHLAAAEAAGEIGRDEVTGMVGFILLAGHETTINLLGSGLWLLLTHRDQWDHLRAQPEALPAAIEEILRYESPEQRTSFRIATSPLEFGGHRIAAGEQIGVIIGSANRDETEFPDADRFDITRTPNRHVAFGFGIHQCMGKHLSRLEARVAFAQILERFPGLRLATTDRPEWRRNSFFRGIASLPVKF